MLAARKLRAGQVPSRWMGHRGATSFSDVLSLKLDSLVCFSGKNLLNQLYLGLFLLHFMCHRKWAQVIPKGKKMRSTSVSVSFCCCNKHHKLSRSKQYKSTILHFWKSEVQNGSYEVQIKVSAELYMFWRLKGESVPCLFQLPGDAWIPQLVAPCHSDLCFHHHISSLWLSCLLFRRTFMITFRAYLDNQE